VRDDDRARGRPGKPDQVDRPLTATAFGGWIQQAQVDFAFFKTVFTDEPEVERIVWLFSMVLGHSRMM
jgi:hypothetical protein